MSTSPNFKLADNMVVVCDTSVIGKFEIWTGAHDDLTDRITIGHYVTSDDPNCGEGKPYPTEGWYEDIPLVWDSGTGKLTGDFGPPTGFPCPSDYNVVTQYRILFENDAPLTGYHFQAWIAEVP